MNYLKTQSVLKAGKLPYISSYLLTHQWDFI